MTKTLIFPKNVGPKAKEEILFSSDLTIQGITSKGVFLKSPQDVLIFLSYESYCGPNTINFPGRQHPFQVEIGETVHLLKDRMDFRNFQISMVEPCPVWQPPPPVEHPDFRGAFRRLVPLGQLVHQQTPDVGFSVYLPFYLDQQIINDLPGQILVSILKAPGFCTILMDIFPHLLGWGKGLTPSGDDFIAGFLLFLYRSSIRRPSDLDDSLHELLKISKIRTTTLANNIIDGAVNGIADERLIALVDYAHGAPGNLEEMAEGLLSYGSSSGIDTLLGVMAAAQRFE